MIFRVEVIDKKPTSNSELVAKIKKYLEKAQEIVQIPQPAGS